MKTNLEKILEEIKLLELNSDVHSQPGCSYEQLSLEKKQQVQAKYRENVYKKLPGFESTAFYSIAGQDGWINNPSENWGTWKRDTAFGTPLTVHIVGKKPEQSEMTCTVHTDSEGESSLIPPTDPIVEVKLQITPVATQLGRSEFDYYVNNKPGGFSGSSGRTHSPDYGNSSRTRVSEQDLERVKIALRNRFPGAEDQEQVRGRLDGMNGIHNPNYSSGKNASYEHGRREGHSAIEGAHAVISGTSNQRHQQRLQTDEYYRIGVEVATEELPRIRQERGFSGQGTMKASEVRTYVAGFYKANKGRIKAYIASRNSTMRGQQRTGRR